MVNHDKATVREIVFCAWPQIRIERLFLQLIKKSSLHLSNTKHWIPPFLVPPSRFQKKFPCSNMSCLRSCLPVSSLKSFFKIPGQNSANTAELLWENNWWGTSTLSGYSLLHDNLCVPIRSLRSSCLRILWYAPCD